MSTTPTAAAPNAEARRIIAQAVRMGYTPRITADGESTTIQVNAGPAGWVEVYYGIDHWSRRPRRFGASAVVARRSDGSDARRRQPATFADIVATIEDIHFTEHHR